MMKWMLMKKNTISDLNKQLELISQLIQEKYQILWEERTKREEIKEVIKRKGLKKKKEKSKKKSTNSSNLKEKKSLKSWEKLSLWLALTKHP